MVWKKKWACANHRACPQWGGGGGGGVEGGREGGREGGGGGVLVEGGIGVGINVPSVHRTLF